MALLADLELDVSQGLVNRDKVDERATGSFVCHEEALKQVEGQELVEVEQG